MAINARHALFKVNIGGMLFEDAPVSQLAKLSGPTGGSFRCLLIQQRFVPAFVIGSDASRAAVASKAGLRRHVNRDVRVVERSRCRAAANVQFSLGRRIVAKVAGGTAAAPINFIDRPWMGLILSKMAGGAEIAKMRVRRRVVQCGNVVVLIQIRIFTEDELVDRYNATHGIHQGSAHADYLVSVTVGGAAGLVDNRQIPRCPRHSRMGKSLIKRPRIPKVASSTAHRSGFMRSDKSCHALMTGKTPLTPPVDDGNFRYEQRSSWWSVGTIREKIDLTLHHFCRSSRISIRRPAVPVLPSLGPHKRKLQPPSTTSHGIERMKEVSAKESTIPSPPASTRRPPGASAASEEVPAVRQDTMVLFQRRSIRHSSPGTKQQREQ